MRRLLLVEFFRGALRRDERSMLFPFLQGLARERGFETLWLAYGGDVAHRPGGPAGQTLYAALPEGDLRSLAGHLKKFRPDRVVTNNPVSREAEELLASRTPPLKHLVMPLVGDLPGGASRADPRGDPARCGWFLDWLGAADPAGAGRYIVEHAVPDYSAVMANAPARSATPQITLASGVLCANRRTVANNPYFAGVDLSEREHRGCSFCPCATNPPITAPGTDILPLLEIQFRRILETAGRDGRNKGRYEFFDIHAFWRFDEVFELVLRLKVPPAIFLFNPRIDDVLRLRERIEKTLPALAKAGHEVRILSMGAENFSETENARFNKGITLAQVDEFLALTEKWSKEHGPVFKPFKAGNDAAELGFILFTPWTTLADVRVNLTRAAARRFPDRGYWLYSILLLEPTTPIYHLAKKEGGILTGTFPDQGQVYGLSKNEGEMNGVHPWTFKDSKTADYFALIVRVCAADREGADCAHFRGDPLFALALSLYRAANAAVRTSPLAIAFALLERLDAAQPPYSREGLLRESVAAAVEACRKEAAAAEALRRKEVAAEAARQAAAAAEASRRVADAAEAAGRPPVPAAPPPAPALSPRAQAVARVLERLSRTKPALFAGTEFKPVEEVVQPGSRRIRLALTASGRELVVDLMDARSKRPCFLSSRRFRAVYHRDALPPTPRELRMLTQLLRLLDAAVEREAP